MDFGWIISGPGSTWVDDNFRLVRNFKAAGVFDDPAEALKILNARHKGIKWKLHKLTAEFLGAHTIIFLTYSALFVWAMTHK